MGEEKKFASVAHNLEGRGKLLFWSVRGERSTPWISPAKPLLPLHKEAQKQDNGHCSVSSTTTQRPLTCLSLQSLFRIWSGGLGSPPKNIEMGEDAVFAPDCAQKGRQSKILRVWVGGEVFEPACAKS